MRDPNTRLLKPDNTDRRPLSALASPIDPLAQQKLKAQQRRTVAMRRELEARQEARRGEH
ncbi:hypothetical protein [Pseudogulbenkiania ferrooxidans]|uniref:Uncharacterized protein n=1 Tax=Pseudogulbenkiania ferrooxidans 2002 TaxID=279714 RepID=B9Z4X1_9NEIS|nr:hypothetical protein [Pseudogulbenkiania ferrooxidans]EEG08203.1 hypothetical protein FuraDRAFT_2406 [Pseudogulbenkiania ferrooxidans 2002]